MLDSRYVDQVALLIDLLPEIASDCKFAIKGGTAINLFLLDLPRLSVDIDLCYLPLTSRDQALIRYRSFSKLPSSYIQRQRASCEKQKNS